MTEFIPTDEPAAEASCCCEAVAFEPEPAYEIPVAETPVATTAVEQVVPEAVPVAPEPAVVAPASSVAEAPATAADPAERPFEPASTVVEGNIPAEFSGLSGQPSTGSIVDGSPTEFSGLSEQTSPAPVRTDYTPQEFIDIGRQAPAISTGQNAVDPNPETRAMDLVLDGLLSDSRPVDRTVAPVMPFYGPMRYSNTLTMIYGL